MERIGIYDARSKLSELIERVQSGEEVVLTRHGEPVARLVPEKRRRKPSRAAAVARMAGPVLFGVSPTDPAVYGAVAAFLGFIAGLASWIPARRAARVDPMVCLRVE